MITPLTALALFVFMHGFVFGVTRGLGARLPWEEC